MAGRIYNFCLVLEIRIWLVHTKYTSEQIKGVVKWGNSGKNLLLYAGELDILSHS